MYGDLNEAELSAESSRKAYELRDHASEREKFWITVAYDTQVTENLEQGHQSCEVWAQTYPRDEAPHDYLAGIIDPVLGRSEEAVSHAKKAIELDPDFAISYAILALDDLMVGRLEDAESILEQASGRRLDIPEFWLERYDLAFLHGDLAEMERIAALAGRDAQAAEWISNHAGSSLAYLGHSQQARRMAEHAADLAHQAGRTESAALYEAGAAVWESFFGHGQAAKHTAVEALGQSSNRGVEYGAALALASSGDSSRAQALANDLAKRFPDDTSVKFSYLPTLRARLALNHGDTADAIELLRIAAPYELGAPRSAVHANFGALYPVYVLGEAHLRQHRGAEAAAEFQKILDHRGIVLSDPIGALAHLQLGRAYALSGDNSKARASYQDFFTLWKDADPDIPVLKQAKAEYAKIK